MDPKFQNNSSDKDKNTEELTFEEEVRRRRKLNQVFAVNEADMSLDKLSTTHKRGMGS